MNAGEFAEFTFQATEATSHLSGFLWNGLVERHNHKLRKVAAR